MSELSVMLADTGPGRGSEMDRNFVAVDPKAPLRILAEDNVQRVVSARGGVRRIVASDRFAAVLYGSHLHPARLHREQPNVLVECQSGDWFGLDPARFNVGYRGGGPLSVELTLVRLGVPAVVAERIAHSSYSDVRFRADGDVHGTPTVGSRPPHNLGAPDNINDQWVVTVAVDSESDLRLVQEWADYLEGPDLPPWISGVEAARVFTDPGWTAAEGLSADELGFKPVTVEIRRGRLVLWIACPVPSGERYLHDHAYAVLDRFNLRFDRLRNCDARSVPWRWLTRRFTPMPTFLVETSTRRNAHPADGVVRWNPA